METIFSSAAPRPTKNTRSAAKPHQHQKRGGLLFYSWLWPNFSWRSGQAPTNRQGDSAPDQVHDQEPAGNSIGIFILAWHFSRACFRRKSKPLGYFPIGRFISIYFGGNYFRRWWNPPQFLLLTCPHRKWFIGLNHNDLLVSNFILINWMTKQSRLIVNTEKIFSPVIWLLRGPAL